MNQELRPTGIDVIGDIPWGTHFCHFYETKKDLLSILTSYFKAGLENNEYCFWVTAPHITVAEAYHALEKSIPGFDRYLERECIEIVTNIEWYGQQGKLNLDSAVPAISDRLRIAFQKNCDGLRANGDESWLDRETWKDFMGYEKEISPLIANQRIIILCAYPLGECVAAMDILDIAFAHKCTVAKRKGVWEVLEVPEIKRSKAQMQREKEMLETDVAEMTEELALVSKTLHKSESRLRAIFNTTDIAFLLLDSDLRVLTYNTIANHWAELSFGASLEAGAYFTDLLKADRKEPVKEMMDKVLAGEHVGYEAEYPLQDATSEWYSISINPVQDRESHVIGICCSATNVTSSKLAELERIKISNDLVQRNKDLEQFSYIVSHNLRAPLANIIGLSKLLERTELRGDEKLKTERFLFQSITKLDEIVKDLNQILQVRRDISEKKEMVSFSEVVDNVLAGFHLLIEREHIRVITDFSEVNRIFTIKSYLHSIFYNLISNSIKYRQADVPLVIEIRALKKDNSINILFKDNARGIDLSVNKEEEVFGLYKRFHTDIEGKGIGLYMVRYQVKALGGDITISSQPKVGSTFSVELPVNQ